MVYIIIHNNIYIYLFDQFSTLKNKYFNRASEIIIGFDTQTLILMDNQKSERDEIIFNQLVNLADIDRSYENISNEHVEVI